MTRSGTCIIAVFRSARTRSVHAGANRRFSTLLFGATLPVVLAFDWRALRRSFCNTTRLASFKFVLTFRAILGHTFRVAVGPEAHACAVHAWGVRRLLG